MTYNTRIAPSPTGDMHIGTARTAYFNWLAAKASGGKFMLRIDDTDQARSKPEYVDVIKDTLAWLGLDYDHFVRQSDRFDRYRELAKVLIDKKMAVPKDGCIILLLPNELPNHWYDEVVGEMSITTNDIENMDGMVLIKSDGSPSYNWATVIDDHDFQINYIIRGVDHITNTSRQVVLWHLLGFELPKFAHVGLIGIKNKPLSKREGAASMLFYKEKGYDSDAMLNFLVRMGWSPTVDDQSTKILPREKMLDMFLFHGKMRGSLANLDLAKLESFDRKYKAEKKMWRTKERLLS